MFCRDQPLWMTMSVGVCVCVCVCVHEYSFLLIERYGSWLTSCKTHSPLRTWFLLQCLLLSKHAHISAYRKILCVSRGVVRMCKVMLSIFLVCPLLRICKWLWLCVCAFVLEWRSRCSVFPTPHCDAETPAWAMNHHGLSARSLRSDTKEYWQKERQRDTPWGMVRLTSLTRAWNPPPGRSHSTKKYKIQNIPLNRK